MTLTEFIRFQMDASPLPHLHFAFIFWTHKDCVPQESQRTLLLLQLSVFSFCVYGLLILVPTTFSVSLITLMCFTCSVFSHLTDRPHVTHLWLCISSLSCSLFSVRSSHVLLCSCSLYPVFTLVPLFILCHFEIFFKFPCILRILPTASKTLSCSSLKK